MRWPEAPPPTPAPPGCFRNWRNACTAPATFRNRMAPPVESHRTPFSAVHLNGAAGAFRRYRAVGLLHLDKTARGARHHRIRGSFNADVSASGGGLHRGRPPGAQKSHRLPFPATPILPRSALESRRRRKDIAAARSRYLHRCCPRRSAVRCVPECDPPTSRHRRSRASRSPSQSDACTFPPAFRQRPVARLGDRDGQIQRGREPAGAAIP